MKKTWQNGDIILRQACLEDAENYYQNFNPLDKEAARLTGSKESYTKEEVLDFFKRAIREENRYFFLIMDKEGRILGEALINDIDSQTRQANFRIGIFQSLHRGKGIGKWVIEAIRDFVFEDLKLHRLALEVFSFNPRAEHVYLKAGFKYEGRLIDAIMDGDKYADIILMAILEDDWKALKNNF